jgi:tripartite-type tricarboxylate transporter receptor subunit TctC
VLLAVLALAASDARADTVADFYRGKLIKVVVGFASGGGYDVYARLLARHFGKYIPGNPSLVVQNMPGAGGLRAANFVYAAAPKDGTTIGTFSRDMPLLAVLGANAGVQFDPQKFTWIGSSSSFVDDAYVLVVRGDAPATSIGEARRPGGASLVLAGSASGAPGNDVPMILRDTIGLNAKVVGGYPDSSAMFLAMERGEVNGRTVDLSTLRTFRAAWLQPGSGMHVLVQFARKRRHPELRDIPTARELAPTDDALALVELAELPYAMARPFLRHRRCRRTAPRRCGRHFSPRSM